MFEGGEGVSGVPEAQDALEPAEVDTVESGDSGDEVDEGSSTETARETVARELKKLQEADSGDEDPEVEEKKEKPVRGAKGKKEKQQPEVVPPPNRLTASQKELFNSLPPELKKATHAMFTAQEAQFTKAQTEMRAAQREAGHIVEAVRPYLLSHPELQEAGYTESKIVSGLLAAHQRLTNPKTAIQAFSELGGQLGFSKEKIQAILNDGKPAGADVAEHPEIVALRNKVRELTSKQESVEQRNLQNTVNSIVSEMEAVRDEKDQFGRYLYPRLHDEPFLEQVKPLVSALVRSVPGLSYGEALKRAYATLDPQNGTPSQNGQARLPQQTIRTERSNAAMASVRGRSAPVLASGDTGEIPDEALGSARDSVRWALNQLRRGQQ